VTFATLLFFKGMRNYFFNALTRQSQYTHGFKNYVYVKIYIKINIIKIVCKEYICVWGRMINHVLIKKLIYVLNFI
jgi:hypothetical protein